MRIGPQTKVCIYIKYFCLKHWGGCGLATFSISKTYGFCIFFFFSGQNKTSIPAGKHHDVYFNFVKWSISLFLHYLQAKYENHLFYQNSLIGRGCPYIYVIIIQPHGGAAT